MNAWLPTRSASRRPYPSSTEGDGRVPDEPQTFEGRLLHRQDEDIEDQGVAFDVGTLVSRRSALGVFGAGAGALVLAACGVEGTSSSSSSGAATTAAASSSSSGTASLTEMTTETAGPYPGDGSNGPDVLEASGVERADLTSSVDGGETVSGVPLTLTMKVIDMANGDAPMKGAAVYVWCADSQGRYSMYSDGVTDATFLRGVQVAGDDGTVSFRMIVPGCYDGRWPHIHFEVFPDLASITDATKNVLTSQIAVPEDVASAAYEDTSTYPSSRTNMAKVSLETDNVFSDGADAQLPAVSGSASAGYTFTIDVPIDTATEQQAAAMPGGGAPGGAGAPPQRP